MLAFEVTNLSMAFGENQVIKDSTFHVEQGSLIYLLGRNGSGKSTLIKALLGLYQPQTGAVKILGEQLTQRRVAQHCGYLPQHAQVDRSFPITVSEMIELECTEQQCPLGVVGHLAQLAGEHLVDKPLRSLSGGELQKVLIARALVTDPAILILDEPMNSLDHASQQALFGLLMELNQQQDKTVLIITHDHNLVQQKTDQILLIHDQQVLTGPAEQMIQEHFSDYGYR